MFILELHFFHNMSLTLSRYRRKINDPISTLTYHEGVNDYIKDTYNDLYINHVLVYKYVQQCMFCELKIMNLRCSDVPFSV